MTAVEMKFRFDIKLREILRALNHPFSTTEINRFLNESQLNLVREYADRYEKDENARQTLSVLTQFHEETSFVQDTTCHPNGYLAELPSDDVLSIVSELFNNDPDVRIKPVAHDEYIVNVNNPFKKPSDTLVWRMDRFDKRELITDGTLVPTSYRVDYLLYPPSIDIDGGTDCVLTPQVHEDIVNGAVAIAYNILQNTARLFNPKTEKQNE